MDVDYFTKTQDYLDDWLRQVVGLLPRCMGRRRAPL